MAYELYMGNILCPVTPSKIQLKIKNQNKTMNLVNGTEVNVLKDAGLTEISYDLLLPNVEYPKSLATYKNGFVNAKYFLDEFEKLKTEKKPFLFKLLRTLPSGVALYDTDDMMVSLESYTIKEDASQGWDVIVSITLKQYKPYGTKIVKVIESTASIENVRDTSNSPSPTDNPVTTHTVVKGDCLWNIAKMYYGDGSKYPAIIEANKDKMTASGSIYPGQVLIIPGAATATKLTQTAKKNATEKATEKAKETPKSTPKSTNPESYVTIVNSSNIDRKFMVQYDVTFGKLASREDRYKIGMTRFYAKKGTKVNLYTKATEDYEDLDKFLPYKVWYNHQLVDNFGKYGFRPYVSETPILLYSFIVEEDFNQLEISVGTYEDFFPKGVLGDKN